MIYGIPPLMQPKPSGQRYLGGQYTEHYPGPNPVQKPPGVYGVCLFAPGHSKLRKFHLQLWRMVAIFKDSGAFITIMGPHVVRCEAIQRSL